MTNQLITNRLPIDYSLISLMSLMSSISYAWHITLWWPVLRLFHNLLLNNLSRFSHPYILGFASLNNSIDSTCNVDWNFRRITSSPLTERLTCTERFMMSNDTINSARSCTSCCGDRFRSLSSQTTINYSSSRFLVERPTWPVLPA